MESGESEGSGEVVWSGEIVESGEIEGSAEVVESAETVGSGDVVKSGEIEGAETVGSRDFVELVESGEIAKSGRLVESLVELPLKKPRDGSESLHLSGLEKRRRHAEWVQQRMLFGEFPARPGAQPPVPEPREEALSQQPGCTAPACSSPFYPGHPGEQARA